MDRLQTRTDARGRGAGDMSDQPSRLRAIVLLAGAVGSNQLPSEVGRSVLELPITGDLNLLDVWDRRIWEFLEEAIDVEGEPEVRILVDPANPIPDLSNRRVGLHFRTERDEGDYRGTAGVLRDLCTGFADDDYLLVGNASQCPDAGLMATLTAGAVEDVGVRLLADRRGAPTGLMLIRCGALRSVPEIGYIDLKEQALPGIAAESGVRVVQIDAIASRPLRRRRDYVDVLRSWHGSESLVGVSALNPYEERWTPSFSIVEPGAQVSGDARLYDSVVLAGGVVEPGCQLVRCVVGPGGLARGRQPVVEKLILGRRLARGTAEEAP